MPSSVPEYKVETLYSGTATVPEFWRGHLKKVCVHISAHQESFSGTVLEHQVWTQPLLMVLVKIKWHIMLLAVLRISGRFADTMLVSPN